MQKIFKIVLTPDVFQFFVKYITVKYMDAGYLLFPYRIFFFYNHSIGRALTFFANDILCKTKYQVLIVISYV